MAKRGENIYRRKDGRWEGRCYKYNENGKRSYHSVYAHSYSEVKQKLNYLKSEATSGNVCTLTINNLFDEWFKANKAKVKPSTLSCYQLKVKKHILPVFGNIRYNNLKADKIYEFINNKINDGLSAKHVSDIIVVFKSMSKYISKTHNIVDKLKNVVLPKKEAKEVILMTDDQQKQLCSNAMKTKGTTKLAVLLSYNMGLRIGEVCGLKWEDINFIKGTMEIRKTVQRIYENDKTILYIGSPKSKYSERIIPIPEFFCYQF